MTLRAAFYAALSTTLLLSGCSHKHHGSRCPTPGCPTVNYTPVQCCPQPTNPCCPPGTTGAFSAPAATVQPVPVQAHTAPNGNCCPIR
jgi:hypothetical protein